MRTRLLPTLLACALIVAVAFAFGPRLISSAQTNNPERYNQGWDQATTWRYYHESQGAVTLPSAFLRALRTKDNKHFLDRAHMATYGFLPGVPAGNPYPLGMVDDDGSKTNGIPMAGLTCAACHTGQLSYHGTTVRIDGGSSDVNLPHFMNDERDDLYRTAADPAARKAFLAEAVALGYPKDKASAGLDYEVSRSKFIEDAASKLPQPFTPGGPGIVDALTGIAFNAMTLGLYEPGNAKKSVAPTNFPPLWQIYHFDWVQYNAFAHQPMARNVGEAIGLGARLNIVDPVTHQVNPKSTRWKSTVNVKNLYWIETALESLQPPPWPAEFGAIDTAKAAKGSALFATNCSMCHGVREIAGTTPEEWAMRVVPLKKIGTDPTAATVFAGTTYNAAKLGLAANMVGYRGLAEIVQNEKEQAYNDAGIPKSEWPTYDGFGRSAPIAAPCGYKARPLVGVWSTPPFLHNGSVPSVFDMLSESRPMHPIIGNTEFDPTKLGMVQETTSTTYTMDTSLEGNSNAGHWFTDDTTRKGRIGRKLTDSEKYDIIEYLKSATYATYPSKTIAAADPLPCGDNPDWALAAK